MLITIRNIGNSRGLVIPKAMLNELGLENQADVQIENGTLVIRRPALTPRQGWAEASQALAQAGDDALILPEFANAEDEEIKW